MDSKFIVKICMNSPESIIYAEFIWRNNDVIIIRNAIYENNKYVVLLSLSFNLSYMKSITSVTNEEFTMYKKAVENAPGYNGNMKECACKEIDERLKKNEIIESIEKEENVYKLNDNKAVKEQTNEISKSPVTTEVNKSIDKNITSKILSENLTSKTLQEDFKNLNLQENFEVKNVHGGLKDKNVHGGLKDKNVTEEFKNTNLQENTKEANTKDKKLKDTNYQEATKDTNLQEATKELIVKDKILHENSKSSKNNWQGRENQFKNKFTFQNSGNYNKHTEKSTRQDKKPLINNKIDISSNVSLKTNRNINLTYKGKKYENLSCLMSSFSENMETHNSNRENWGIKGEASVVEKGKKIYMVGKSKFFNRKFF